MMQRRVTTQIHWNKAALQFLFDQHRSSLSPAILQRKQSQDMRRSSFQFRDQLLCSAAKERIEDHRWDTDGQSGSRVHQCLADPARQGYVTRRADVGPQSAEGMD